MSEDTVTTNITLPKSDWKALKILAMEYGLSMAEIIRKGVKTMISSGAKAIAKKHKITANGFTKEFEDQVLEAAREPWSKSKVWNGKGSFVDFVLNK